MNGNVNGEIFVNSQRTTSPLGTFKLYKDSSAKFFVHAPDGISALAFVLNSVSVPCMFDARMRGWYVYLPPTHFATARNLTFELRGTDDHGNTVMLGRGTVRVIE